MELLEQFNGLFGINNSSSRGDPRPDTTSQTTAVPRGAAVKQASGRQGRLPSADGNTRGQTKSLMARFSGAGWPAQTILGDQKDSLVNFLMSKAGGYVASEDEEKTDHRTKEKNRMLHDEDFLMLLGEPGPDDAELMPRTSQSELEKWPMETPGGENQPEGASISVNVIGAQHLPQLAKGPCSVFARIEYGVRKERTSSLQSAAPFWRETFCLEYVPMGTLTVRILHQLPDNAEFELGYVTLRHDTIYNDCADFGTWFPIVRNGPLKDALLLPQSCPSLKLCVTSHGLPSRYGTRGNISRLVISSDSNNTMAIESAQAATDGYALQASHSAGLPHEIRTTGPTRAAETFARSLPVVWGVQDTCGQHDVAVTKQDDRTQSLIPTPQVHKAEEAVGALNIQKETVDSLGADDSLTVQREPSNNTTEQSAVGTPADTNKEHAPGDAGASFTSCSAPVNEASGDQQSASADSSGEPQGLGVYAQPEPIRARQSNGIPAICFRCSLETPVTFFKCGMCRAVIYCSGECASLAWDEGHHMSCSPCTRVKASRPSPVTGSSTSAEGEPKPAEAQAAVEANARQHVVSTRVSKPLAPVSPESHAQETIESVPSLVKSQGSNSPAADARRDEEKDFPAADNVSRQQIGKRMNERPTRSEEVGTSRPEQQSGPEEQVDKKKPQKGATFPRVLPVKIMASPPRAEIQEFKMPPFPVALQQSQTPEDLAKSQSDSAPETPPTLPRKPLMGDSHAQEGLGAIPRHARKRDDSMPSDARRNHSPTSDLWEFESKDELAARLQGLARRAKALADEGRQAAADRMLRKLEQFELLLNDAKHGDGAGASALGIPAHKMQGPEHVVPSTSPDISPLPHRPAMYGPEVMM